MLEGNLAEFFESFTDDEVRFLVVFVQAEFKMPNMHAGSLFFVSRQALSETIDVFLTRERTFQWQKFNWSKLFVPVADLLPVGHRLLRSIQRKIERRSYQLDTKPKKRKFLLKLYKDGNVVHAYRCKTRAIAEGRGTYWSTGEGKQS